MLSIRELVKIYPGPVTALAGINLDLTPGMFGLLGPNGAGKTTLMRILAGLLEPTAGRVSLDGEDVVADPRRMRRRLGYLPQDFGFYPYLTGLKMLVYLLQLKGVEAPGGLDRLASELLERVNLTGAAHRKLKGYSGGMRQRLGIAQAIAGDPRVLIVDEPTAGLDPEERMRFYRLLAELAADRIVVLSTHIVEDVAVLCPRFAIIRQGRLVAETSPSAARAAIEGRIFEGRVASADLAALGRERQIIQAVLVEGENRVRAFVPHGEAPPDGFHAVAATLEDAYLLRMRDLQNGSGAPAGDAAESPAPPDWGGPAALADRGGPAAPDSAAPAMPADEAAPAAPEAAP
jgi:ABC-2 type transport system ATP-binding protein